MALEIILLLGILFKEVAMEDFASRKARIDTHEDMFLPSVNKEGFLVASMIQCSQKCVASSKSYIRSNFRAISTQKGYECEIVHLPDASAETQAREKWVYMANSFMVGSEKEQKARKSCKTIKNQNPGAPNGVYLSSNDACCDMANGGFTLAARFSNADEKHWLSYSGDFWYTKESYGEVSSSDHNGDMVNLAFALVIGSDIKVSRSDDNNHTALLLASNCLEGRSPRKKITSYGDFRNGTQWGRNKCLGSCNAVFSGKYMETSGFLNATSTCTSPNDILNGSNIGIWCHYESGDGSVIMIGGGGGSCSRADYGIAITENDSHVGRRFASV